MTGGIVSYTPLWLSRPSPGFNLFQPTSPERLSQIGSKPRRGQQRTIATRGTEVFVAVGDEIRWSDLLWIRDQWDDEHVGKNSLRASNGDAQEARHYRVLKTSVSSTIKQLLVSPRGDHLAIVTSHTVHIAILPHSALLTSDDTAPLKIKTFQLGPTSHVVDRSPVASVLWHPLGVDGTCLVTITVDAVLRLWELNKSNRWSFDSPALSFDLKKLADGSTITDDFSPSKYGTNKGFSPDSFDLEIAAACFGQTSIRNEKGWSPMTLWLSTSDGDVYALCPLLPSKWQMPLDFFENVARLVELRAADVETTPFSQETIRTMSGQQSSWISELQQQSTSSDGDCGIYRRPAVPGAIPKLQGPFQLSSDADVWDVTDIHYVCVSSEQEEVDDDLQIPSHDTNLGFICIAASSGEVHVFLDMDGVTGQWLPQTPPSNTEAENESSSLHELLLLESISLGSPHEGAGSMFTTDEHSECCILVTHPAGVTRVDVTPLVMKLTDELRSAHESGGDFRMDLLVQSTRCAVTTVLETSSRLITNKQVVDASAPDFAACVGIEDSDLGYFLLNSMNGQPQAVTLDATNHIGPATTDGINDELDHEIKWLAIGEPRQSYQPPPALWAESGLPAFIDEHVHGRNRRSFREDVRLSPATLKVLMDAHRILSHETYQLGLAAADLFRRCERLQNEFKEQLRRANDAATKIESVLEDDSNDFDEGDDNVGMSSNIERRVTRACKRRDGLSERYMEIRRKVGRLDGRSLSKREQAWVDEVRGMEASIGVAQDPPPGMNSEDKGGLQATVRQRLQEVQILNAQLLGRVEGFTDTETGDETGSAESASASASPGYRQSSMVQITAMLDRQSALVDATRHKMERLLAAAM